MWYGCVYALYIFRSLALVITVATYIMALIRTLIHVVKDTFKIYIKKGLKRVRNAIRNNFGLKYLTETPRCFILFLIDNQCTCA